MIKLATHSVVITQLIVFLYAASVHAADDDISGVWINTDADTQGIIKLAIVEKDGESTIRAWGACTPEYCDLGTTKLHRLGDSVKKPPDSVNESKILPFGFATWDHDRATRHLTLQLTHEKVEIALFTVFKDLPAREGYRSDNYRSQYTFRRAEGKEAVIPPEHKQKP